MLESDEYGLPDFVDYHPNTNLIEADLPNEANFVFSRFVLEHVRPEDILRMHQKLNNDGSDDLHIIHLISPSDHRAYNDPSLSLLDFLQFSSTEWKRIQTKFDYHNRLRLPQYLNIFEQAGFEVLFEEHTGLDSKSKQFQLFKQLHIHSDFAGMTEEELCAGAINVLLRKKK